MQRHINNTKTKLLIYFVYVDFSVIYSSLNVFSLIMWELIEGFHDNIIFALFILISVFVHEIHHNLELIKN